MFVRSKTFLIFYFLVESSSSFLLKNKQLEQKHKVPQKVRADKLSLNPDKSKNKKQKNKKEEKKKEKRKKQNKENPTKNGHNLH